MIHKKILEAAGERPDAPMAEVADQVSGASTDLVERVLREYGDPAAVESDPEEPTASDGGSASASGLNPGDDHRTADGGSPDTGSQAEGATADATDSESTESVTGTGDAGPSGSGTGDAAPPESEQPETDESGADDAATAVTGGDRTDAAGEAASAETGVAIPDELTEKERAVLEVVAERPAATQQEVADVLGVSRATVSKRASGIEGFDWQRRAAFVERVFDGEASLTRGASERSTVDPNTLERSDARTDGDQRSDAQTDGDRVAGDARSDTHGPGDATGEVLSRLDRIEDRLDGLESGDASGPSGGIADPELAHKVVHACMESDHVSEDEELQVVAAVLNGTAGD